MAGLKLNVDPSGMIAGLKRGKEALREVGTQARKTESATEQMSAKGTTAMRGFASAATKLAGTVGLVATAFKGVQFFGGAVNEAEKFQTAMFRVNAIIKATGGAAGKTAEQLREQARQIALTTLDSTEGVLRAQQTLLTFRSIQGDVFDRAINDAEDLAAAMGIDVNSAVLQLGKALEEPITGMTALTRSGTVFTTEQKAVVKAMVETGRKAEAQAFILTELEKQYKGTAKAAASGLAGALDTLSQRFQEMQLAAADSFNLIAAKTAVANTLSSVLVSLTNHMDGIASAFSAMGTAIEFVALTQVPSLITGLYGLATSEGIAYGATAALSVAVKALGGYVGIATGGLSLIGIGLLNARKDAKGLADALESVKSAQEKLTTATSTYYTTITAQNLNAMKAAAENAKKQLEAAVTVAKAELASAGFYTNLFGHSLFETDRMKSAKKALIEYQGNLAQVVSQLDAINVRIANQPNVPNTGASAEQIAASDEILKSLQDQVAEQRLIIQFGKNSAAVTNLRAMNEKESFAATLKSKNITGELANNIMAAFNVAQQLKTEAQETTFQRAASTAGQLAEKLGVSVKNASKLLGMGFGEKKTIFDPRDPRFNKTAATMAQIHANTQVGLSVPVVPASGGGGGGGGGGVSAGLSEAQNLFDSTRTSAEKYASEIANINKLHEQFPQIVTDDVVARGLDQLKTKFASAASSATKSAQSIADTMAQSIGGGFTDMIKGTQSVGDAFRTMAQGIIDQLLQVLVVQKLVGSYDAKTGTGTGIVGFLGGITSGLVAHSGGVVGEISTSRMVPAMAFAGAPRMHNGGFAGLKRDEVPAILQRGERVLSRSEVAAGSGAPNVTVNIQAKDPESFKQSRTQIAAGIQRAVAAGQRGM